tara:strand:+ start:4991 stop:5335 length:345 start_codon:yes stop_codon:yes gene_type:complete
MNGINFVYVEDIARIMGVDKKTIYRWVKSGKLPQPSTFGGKTFRWQAGVIEAWVESGLNQQSGMGDHDESKPDTVNSEERQIKRPEDIEDGCSESSGIGEAEYSRSESYCDGQE